MIEGCARKITEFSIPLRKFERKCRQSHIPVMRNDFAHFQDSHYDPRQTQNRRVSQHVIHATPALISLAVELHVYADT